MNKPMIRLNIPYTDERELEEIAKVLKSGYLTQGPKVAEFENKVTSLIGSKYAFAMSSCTTALHLALVVLGIKPGDEVIVSDFTFPATANVVVQLGAVPVLADINMDTMTLDPAEIERLVTDKTRAIMVVDAFGCAADYDLINAIAEQYKLPVVEDAATSIGTRYYDRYCGNLTTMGCFSFHPRKAITTGEGGMITTNDEYLAEKIRLLRSHGGVRVGNWYEFVEAGFNYRLSDVQGAIGVAQMEKLQWIIDQKRTMAARLSERLAHIPGLTLPKEPKWGGHIYQSYVVLVDESIDRDATINNLKANGVEATLGTYALHDQPFFQREYHYKTGQLPNSHVAFTKSITLPLYPQLSECDLDIIAQQLKSAVSK
jgi:dTDP-4-amino-4,6-dideoxygalactose transaminase